MVQLPVSNYLHLLTPLPRAGELSDKASSSRSGPPRAGITGRGGESWHSCVRTLRGRWGRRRLARCTRTVGSRPHRPEDASVSGQVAARDADFLPPPTRSKYGGKYHQKKTDIGVQNILCAVKPLIMLATFTCRGKDESLVVPGDLSVPPNAYIGNVC